MNDYQQKPTKMLLFYDNTGVVWHITWGVEVVPDGVLGIVTNIPSCKFSRVSVNPETKEPIFTFEEDTTFEIDNLQNVSINHENRISTLEARLLALEEGNA